MLADGLKAAAAAAPLTLTADCERVGAADCKRATDERRPNSLSHRQLRAELRQVAGGGGLLRELRGLLSFGLQLLARLSRAFERAAGQLAEAKAAEAAARF